MSLKFKPRPSVMNLSGPRTLIPRPQLRPALRYKSLSRTVGKVRENWMSILAPFDKGNRLFGCLVFIIQTDAHLATTMWTYLQLRSCAPIYN